MCSRWTRNEHYFCNWTGITAYFNFSFAARGPEMNIISATGPETQLIQIFQVLHVGQKCSIKDYVQRNSLIFKAGRGFYEFTKPEIISAKKEVVLLDKNTGDMFTGQRKEQQVELIVLRRYSDMTEENCRSRVVANYDRILIAI